MNSANQILIPAATVYVHFTLKLLRKAWTQFYPNEGQITAQAESLSPQPKH